MRDLFSEFLLALIKTVKSECFAALNATVTAGATLFVPAFLEELLWKISNYMKLMKNTSII